MLGIIGAMDEEVAQIKEKMTDVTVTSVAGMDFYQGKLGGKDAVVVRSGICLLYTSPSKPFQYSMLQNRVMQMIRKNDIRDENGELLNFGTHTFRHCYGKKLTEMHIDDWMIARLLGHKTLQSVHHYRKIGNKIMADETRAVREKIDMIRCV